MHQCSFKSNLGERSWYKDHLQTSFAILKLLSTQLQFRWTTFSLNLQYWQDFAFKTYSRMTFRLSKASRASIKDLYQSKPPSHPWRMQKFIWTEPFCIHSNMTVFSFLAMESIPSYASGSAYGFSDKVIDGITVTVNSVILTLVSRVFTASIQVRWQIRSGH